MAAGHPPNSQALLGNDPLADAAHSLLRRSSPRTSDNRRQTDSGPSTRIDTYWSHQRSPVDRLSGFFSAAPTLEHLKLPLSFFSKEERGLPLWPLYSALCELLHPAPGRRCFSRAWSAAWFLLQHAPLPCVLLLCHGNSHHPPPFRGFCSLVPSVPTSPVAHQVKAPFHMQPQPVQLLGQR